MQRWAPLVLAVVVAAGTLLVVRGQQTREVAAPTGKPIVSIKLPELTTVAKAGQRLFAENCASCHGVNAVGQAGVAPPLVHKIYEPSHHSDISFQRAAKYGVRAHHWPFGNMPAVANVSEEDVSKITLYVRELQRANGIE
ncbi:MAG: cytochrome c [Pseudomonadota bacterium]